MVPAGGPMRHEDAVWNAMFSQDGARVVTACGSEGRPGTAQLWDAATGAPLGAPLRHEAPVRSAAFSPDGARVVTASSDGTARLWDAATGAPRGRPMWHGRRGVLARVRPRDGAGG